MSDIEEKIVMTPKCKTANSTTLIVERRAVQQTSEKMHVAGGDHTGIVINKEQVQDDKEVGPCHATVQFIVYLVESSSGRHKRESRALRSWFKAALPPDERHRKAQDFFRDLVSPPDFPRDYVGFIKKIMKLMQHEYTSLQRLEVELTQLAEATPPPRPLSVDETFGQIIIITVKKVLELIEAAYPNPITPKDIASGHGWSEEEVAQCLQELVQRGEVRALEHGAFTRHHETDTHVQVVKQMPTVVSSKQPSIAIITALYCEKLAVDAMVDNKETFVRYTTVGESNVYTLGNIGAHRVVSTKLPSLGHTREAMTAAGNTTTRLLGTFQKVDHVLLVGVAGGVPHYTDYSRHVRLGDVVVSTPDPSNKYVYVYCEKALPNTMGGYDFETRPYKPKDSGLLELSKTLYSQPEAPWLKYIEEVSELELEMRAPSYYLALPERTNQRIIALNNHKQYFSGWFSLAELDYDLEPSVQALTQKFQKVRAKSLNIEIPDTETDKLYMSLGEQGMIEVAHPTPTHNNNISECGGRVQLGPVVGVGSVSAAARAALATHCSALALAAPLHPVLDSVIGNCRDSFVCIRGISDYQDGSRGKEWQPYASLVAAAVMKALVCAMDPPAND